MIPRELRRVLNDRYGSTELETESLHFAEHGRALQARDAIALYEIYKLGTNAAVNDYFQFIERCLRRFTLVHHDFTSGVTSFNRHPDARNNPAGWAGMGLVPEAAYLYTLSKEGIAGDFLECGVFLGGSTCCFSHVGAELDFKVFAADSFEGLPESSADGFYQKGDFAGRLDVVMHNVRSYGVAQRVVPIQGYFDTSLKGFAHPLRALFLDTDLYVSSRAALDNVYDRLASGGVVFSDGVGMSRDFRDGHFAPASEEARAVHDFFHAHGLSYSGAGSGFDYLSIFVAGSDRPLVYSADFILMVMLLSMTRTLESQRAPEHVAYELREALFGAFGRYSYQIVQPSAQPAAVRSRSRLDWIAEKVSSLARLVRP
jgi:predicted O-methyltransferase YrrM